MFWIALTVAVGMLARMLLRVRRADELDVGGGAIGLHDRQLFTALTDRPFEEE